MMVDYGGVCFEMTLKENKENSVQVLYFVVVAISIELRCACEWHTGLGTLRMLFTVCKHQSLLLQLSGLTKCFYCMKTQKM